MSTVICSDRQFKFLNLLDRHIEIVIRPHNDPNHEAGIMLPKESCTLDRPILSWRAITATPLS